MVRHRALIVLTVLFMLPENGAAAAYRCTLERGEPGRRKAVWSGRIVLKDGVDTVAQGYIVKRDGTLLSTDDLDFGDPKVPIEDLMKPYDGLYGFSLRRSGGRLDLSGGRLDSRRQARLSKRNISLMDAAAVASADAKEIGLLDGRAEIWILCRASGSAD